MQTFLHGERLQLRPAKLDDLPALHACWREPAGRGALFDDHGVSLALARQLLVACLAVPAWGVGLWTLRQGFTRVERSIVGAASASSPQGAGAEGNGRRRDRPRHPLTRPQSATHAHGATPVW